MASHVRHDEHHETAKEARARHEHEADEAADKAAAAPAPKSGKASSFDEICTAAKDNPNCKACAERVFVGIADRFSEAVMASSAAGATTVELAPITMLVDQLRFGANALAAAIVQNTPVAKG